MKEKPILFSTPMVQALLEGRKTQTRRVLSANWLRCLDPEDDREEILKRCPYGQPGDLLWVRETWMDYPNAHLSGAPKWKYLASASLQYIEEWPKSWKPSIHMPKEAARIWLRITEVRVERLQDISDNDAKAEGIERINYKGIECWKSYAGTKGFGNAKDSFWSLWQSINGPDSWESNPFVWVVKFEVVSTTGKEGIK